MVGDLEAHHARQGFEMVPDMAARDRAAGDPNEPVMLAIVEALDPEARADHAGKNDRHRGPAADQDDDIDQAVAALETLNDAVVDRGQPAVIAKHRSAIGRAPV